MNGTGDHRPKPGFIVDNAIRAIIETYRNPVIRIYSRMRFLILRQSFLEEIGQYLPREGRILDLGCGFGLFTLYFALRAPSRRIIGVDLDEKRIRYAQRSAVELALENVEYRVGNALEWSTTDRFDAIYMLDLIHHLPVERVPDFLARARDLLKPQGTLILKDVADRPRYKMLFTLLLDRLMVGFEPIRYWPPQELADLLATLGFDVVRHRMTDYLPYPHILYVAHLRTDR